MRFAFRTFLIAIAAISLHAQQPASKGTFAQLTSSVFSTGPVSRSGGGTLYGVTTTGGPLNGGYVYSLTPPAEAGGAWTLTTLYSFPLPVTQAFEIGQVTIAPDGVLYGIAPQQGNGNGIVFELTPPNKIGGSWTEKDIYTFTGGSDGGAPFGSVIFGPQGVLYGAADAGGGGAGVIYQLTRPSANSSIWSEQVLYSFSNDFGAPGYPRGPLTLGKGGVLFGSASGGMNATCTNCGVIFELTPPAQTGAEWGLNVIHSFTFTEGIEPDEALVFGQNGALYGSTATEGTLPNGGVGYGTVFELAPPTASGGAWALTNLHVFSGQLGDGSLPNGGVVFGPTGALVGITFEGGLGPCSMMGGCGVLYQLNPPVTAGSPWEEKILHSFSWLSSDPTGSYGPEGSVAVGPKGGIFGTAPNTGTVYEFLHD